MFIEKVTGFELLDSRGNPTVGARVRLSCGAEGFSIVPSGASTGTHEACELRDNDRTRYSGKGVQMAAANICGEINDCLKGQNALNQRTVDGEMINLDGTPNKSRLGANAILAVSLAVSKAAANALGIPLYRYIGGVNANVLPTPMMNILNGGAHASNNIDIQEFMITPVRAENFSDGVRKCTEIYHKLGELLKAKNLSCGVGDEGGFAPNLNSDEEAIELICRAIEEASYSTDEIKICLDAASSEWYKDGEYMMPKRKIGFTAEKLIEYYEELCNKYPIISIEDGLSEDDFDSFAKMTEKMGNRIQLVGDDLFVTNTERLKKGISMGAANAILIKPNQIGTLSETLDVINVAKAAGYKTVISHRSGESEDTSVADIAVAVNAGQIKTGAPCRTDRNAKYNRLMIIEKELMAGLDF